jgi:hypothetical protein
MSAAFFAEARNGRAFAFAIFVSTNPNRTFVTATARIVYWRCFTSRTPGYSVHVYPTLERSIQLDRMCVETAAAEFSVTIYPSLTGMREPGS